MPKYHIKKDGTPGICHAVPGNCPLGSNEQHYNTLEEATEQADLQNSEHFLEDNRDNYDNLPNVDFKELFNNQQIAVGYITGSRLQGLQHLNSDFDYYVFTVPTKRQLIMKDSNKGDTLHCDDKHSEAKSFMIEHMISLINKANPNVAEFFFKKPIYVDKETKKLTDYLYSVREKIPYIDQHRYLSAAGGMMRGNTKRFRPDKIYAGEGSFGKEVFNFLKAYEYGKAVAKHQPLAPKIFPKGEELIKQRKIKLLKTYDQKVIDDLHVEDKINEINKYADDLKGTPKDEIIINKMIDYMPIYRD